jgi:hypothetical protein
MSKPSLFTVTQPGIGEILKQHRLRVPPRQRDYSWTEKEVTTLFQDLKNAMNDEKTEAYFLGTIVTIPDASGTLEVIDGQQRLATITILLCNIRRYLLAMNIEPVISEDIKQFFVYIDRTQRATLNRLRMNVVDNEFFSAMLDDELVNVPPEPTRISHRLIKAAFDNAANYVKTIVAGYNPKDHGDVLNRWVTFIEKRAEVILLQVPSGANAYRMFETLNDRGLKTTQADLVKNYLFSQAGDERLDEMQDSWSAMRGTLESLQEEEKEDLTVTFLRQALMVIRGFLRKDKVYEEVQNSKGPQATVAFLKKVESLAKVYVATFFRDHDHWKSYPDAILSAIDTINFFDIVPFRPALLAVAAKFPPKEALSAFQMFISLGVRLIIAASTRTGSVEETLAEAANKIYLGRISTAAEMKTEISRLIPNDTQFKEAFETAKVSKQPLARYYLRTLENVAQKRPDPYYVLQSDKEEVSLEHVLPERPGNNWPQFNPEEVVSYSRRIGNMVLLRYKDNSDLKSKPFQEKIPVYENCPYKLTSQVATVQNWTVDRIRERQMGLAKLALRAWPI